MKISSKKNLTEHSTRLGKGTIFQKRSFTEAAMEPVLENDDIVVSGVGPSHLHGCVVRLGP